jgi:endonuclease III related protein
MAVRRGYRVTSMRNRAIEVGGSIPEFRAATAASRLKSSRSPRRVAALPPIASGRPPLDEYFNSLFTALGPQHWWPGKTPFEVIVGAVLTQNTSWTNVERAISNLRRAGLLSPAAMEKVPLRRLERMIRSSGYFRQKARKLKAFCEFLRAGYGGSLKRMFETPTIVLRERLLEVFGIGPETADSILLYAGDHPVFVVDAYTKRMLSRHGWTAENAKYDDVRWMFEREFPGDVKRFNEFHALIVNTGKNFCRTHDPLCGECPLGRYLEEGR